jgi:hypothetical protein
MLADKMTRETIQQGWPARKSARWVTAAETLTTRDSVIYASASTALGGDYSITLPNVAEARGQVLSFHVTIADSKTVTVQDQDDSDGWTDLDMDADTDYQQIMSDGIHWNLFTTGIA